MVTPRKIAIPNNQRKPQPDSSYSEQSPAEQNPKHNASFSHLVRVAKTHAQVNTFSSSQEREYVSKDNMTLENLYEIDMESGDSPVSDHLFPKHSQSDQPARIQLTLPSVEPSASVSLMSEGLLGSDEFPGEISSTSSGEV